MRPHFQVGARIRNMRTTQILDAATALRAAASRVAGVLPRNASPASSRVSGSRRVNRAAISFSPITDRRSDTWRAREMRARCGDTRDGLTIGPAKIFRRATRFFGAWLRGFDPYVNR
jgi:hypothetical protein